MYSNGTITTLTVDEPCKCCGGTGVQTRATDGIKIRCPACNGTGKWDHGGYSYVPWCEVQPWPQPPYEWTCNYIFNTQ